jgi:UDP-GlcNAc:undecaprenyl-phosphate/decaprenyl-phosphate GlcNAc-1-phosphate transferase
MPGIVPGIGSEGLARSPWAAPAAALVAAAVVLLLVPPLRGVARRTGYLDHPEARKPHARATPLLGGISVAAGAFVGCGAVIWYLGVHLPGAASWWAFGALAALVLGLVDDRFGMKPGPKLAFQVLAGTLFLAGGSYPTAGLGPLIGLPIALLWIVAVMNAVNFLDNMDGIVSGVSTILATGLGLLLLSWRHDAEALFAFALAGATLAFLRFNFSPASVFLGDAGSLFLGYTLASLSLLAAGVGADIKGLLASLLILGYPVFDLCFVVATRILEGRKIYEGGRDHTTHRLSRLLGGPRRTALGVYACAFFLTWSGVWASRAEGFREILPWIAAWALGLTALGLRLARVPVPPTVSPPRIPM